VSGLDRRLRTSHVPQECIDICLHAAGVIEQALGGLQHFIGSGEGCIGMTVEVDDIRSDRT